MSGDEHFFQDSVENSKLENDNLNYEMLNLTLTAPSSTDFTEPPSLRSGFGLNYAPKSLRGQAWLGPG